MMTKLLAVIMVFGMVAVSLASIIYGAKLTAAVVIILAVVLIIDAAVTWVTGKKRQ